MSNNTQEPHQAIAQLLDAGGARPEPAAHVSDTLDALRKLGLLLRGTDLNALQISSVPTFEHQDVVS